VPGKLGWSDLSGKRIILIALVTATLLAGGSAAYAYLAVDRPVASLLRAHPDVASYTIVRRGPEPPVITVLLGPVAELALVYEGLERDLTRRLGGPCQLVIEDRRSAELSQWWRHAHVAIHEGIVSGQFVAMRERLAALAAGAGAELRLTVAQDRVFVQCMGNGSYLYAVVPRRGAGGSE
jgi:hypothetical protein